MYNVEYTCIYYVIFCMCIRIPSIFAGLLPVQDIPLTPKAHAQRFREMRLDAQMQQVRRFGIR